MPQLSRMRNVMLSALCISATVTSSAAADGVVLVSSSEQYERGQIIKTGDRIEIAAEQSLTVLDQSGQIILFEESGEYGLHDVSAPSDLNPLDAAFYSGSRSEIGGTRTGEADYQSCLDMAEDESSGVSLIMCEEMREKDQSGSMSVELFGGDRLSMGAPFWLKIRTDFDAWVGCRFADQPWMPLGGHETALRTMTNVVTMAPRRGGDSVNAPDQSGAYEITCTAIEGVSWTAAHSAASIDASEVELVAAFATLQGKKVATQKMSVVVD